MKIKSYLSVYIMALTLIAWQAAADDALTSLTPFGVELGKPFTDNALILSKTDHDTYSEMNLRAFPKPLSLMHDTCVTDAPVELNSGSTSRCRAVLRVNKFDQRVHGVSFFARGARVNAKSYIQKIKATLNKKYPSLECHYPLELVNEWVTKDVKRFDETTCLYPRDDYQNGNFQSIQLEQAGTHALNIRLTANDEDSLALEFINRTIHKTDGLANTKGDMDAF